MKKSKRAKGIVRLTPQKCDGCGRKYQWDPGHSVAIHVTAESPHAESIGLLGARTTKEALKLLVAKTKRMEAIVERVGNLPTHLYLNFCSTQCALPGNYGRAVARRKMMEFYRAHLRSGLDYYSFLSVRSKDPLALLRLIGSGTS